MEIAGDGIRNPGVYYLPSDSRTIDLIREAGGLREDAYLQTIPLRQRLFEGMQITLPTRKVLEEIKAGKRPLTRDNLIPFRSFREEPAGNNLININTASHYALQELMGIGPVLAENIIHYREEEGPFQSTDELEEVPGIGEITYRQLSEKVTVR